MADNVKILIPKPNSKVLSTSTFYKLYERCIGFLYWSAGDRQGAAPVHFRRTVKRSPCIAQCHNFISFKRGSRHAAYAQLKHCDGEYREYY